MKFGTIKKIKVKGMAIYDAKRQNKFLEKGKKRKGKKSRKDIPWRLAISLPGTYKHG